MLTYELNLNGQNLTGADRFSIAAESNESIQLRFHFDRSWRIFDTKAAVFRDSQHRYYVMEITGSCVKVPWEVLRNDLGFDLAVVAYNENKVYTSKRVTVSVSESLLPELCRQLSPTDTLFDKIRLQCKNEAELECRNEIQAMKHSYENALADMGRQLEDERRNTAAVAAEKDTEIAELNYQAECTAVQHNTQIAALNAQLAAKEEKAHNWDLVNTAISQKSNSSLQLWNGGSDYFELPMLDTSNVTVFNSGYISTYLTKAGFDMSSVTSLSSAFSSRNNLKEITLKNTDNVTTCYNIFYLCSSLEYADLGNLRMCSNLQAGFSGCTSLVKLKLGNVERISAMQIAFNECLSLKEIDGVFDTTLCTSFTDVFTNCTNLETVRFAENCIRANISFDKCISLTKDSLFNIANALSNEVTGILRISHVALNNSLSEEEREEFSEIVTGKNWTLTKV